MASKLLLAVSMVLSLLLLLRYAEAKAFPGVSARKEDIKFIKCEVCLQISNQLSKNVETKRRDVAPLKEFRKESETIVEIVRPINTMLRLVDSDLPCLGKVYEGMDRMIESSDIPIDRVEQLRERCIFRWNQILSPLACAAYVLNPEFQGRRQERDKEVMTGWEKVLDKQVPIELHRKLSEFQIIEMAENVCNLKKADADWILHMDIVEEGDKLKLVEQEQEGECNSECKTIEKACEEVMGDHDTDVAEFLFKGKSQGGALADFLCKDLSNVCVHKPPPVPKDRKPGEPFTPKSSKDAEMEKIMRSLGDMPGAPSMKMYSREDLMNGGMPNSEEDDEDEEDDDDDSQTVSQAKSGSRIDGLLKRTHSFINTMKVGTNNAIKSVQKKVQKTSRQFHRWWSKKTTSDRKRHSKRKSSKSSSEEL